MDNKKIQTIINKLNFTSTLDVDGIIGSITNKAIDFLYNNIILTKKPTKMETIYKDLEKILSSKEKNTIKCNYVTQRTDYEYSHRMCNIASLLMLKDFYTSDKSEDKDIISMDTFIDADYDIKKWAEKNKLDYYISNKKLEQVSEVIAMVLRDETKKNITVNYLSKDEIKKTLDNKNILIAATKLPGYINGNVNAGHYIVVIGYIENAFIIHDPYGMYEDGYKKGSDIKTKGENVIIPEKILFGSFGWKTAKEDGLNNNSTYRSISIKL